MRYIHFSMTVLVLSLLMSSFSNSLEAQNNEPALTLEQAEKEKKDAFSEYTRLVTTGGEGDPQAALQRYQQSHAVVEELRARAASAPAPAADIEEVAPKTTIAAKNTVEIGVEAPIGELDYSKVDIFDSGAAVIAHEWLGWLAANGGVNVIIQPRNHFEFYAELGKIARSNLREGKKVSRIVISAHGSPVEAGFNLEKAVMPAHVDIARLNKNFLSRRDEIFKLKESLYGAEAADIEISAEDKKKLTDGLNAAVNAFDTDSQFLNDMEHISQAMADDAVILLAVCYQSRTPAHEAFIKDFGDTILSYSGGAIVTARTAVALSRGNLVVNYWLDVFGIEEEKGQVDIGTKSWWRDRYENGYTPNSSKMTWFTSNWIVTEAEKKTRTISPLKVSFIDDLQEVEPEGTLSLKPVVDSFPDSGQLTYRWSNGSAESTAEVFDFKAAPGAVGLQKVDVVVRDARGREGLGRMFINVRKSSGSTSVETSYRFAIGDLSGGPSRQGVAKYKHLWSEPKEELIPGQPFDIDIKVEQLERSIPADAIIIGEMRFSVGIMVTAGREWIDDFVKNDRPSRKQGQIYDPPSPSSQLYLGEYMASGHIVNFDPADPSSGSKWVENASKRFTAPVPDLIPDKTSYQLPTKNIEGEELLVVIYAIGGQSTVYLDSNYLYQLSPGADGKQVWRLVRQWQTSEKEWQAADGSSSASLR